MAIINGQGRVGVRVTSGGSPVTSQYPSSLKLFIDAGNPLSYSGTGTTVTDLVGTQNGTLVNGVGYSSSNGGYFTFDGVNDYITFGTNTSIQPTAARTVSTWVYVDPTSIVGAYYSDGNQGTDRNGFGMWIDINGYRVELANASTYQLAYNSGYIGYPPAVNPVGITRGVWYYLTTSWNGTSVKTYLNGSLFNTYSQTVIPTNGLYPTILGNCNGYNMYFKGNISQLKIYNTQLSDAEVLTDFNEFKTRYGYLSDSDAAAFVSAAGITDSTQASAVNTLVTSLKSAGLWTKMKAIYPVVGGNATAHSKNLKDPSLYNLTFSTGWLHSSTGMLPNALYVYANTNLNPTTIGMSQNSACYGAYSRTQNGANTALLGAFNPANNINVSIFPNYSTNQFYTSLNGAESYTLPYTNTNSKGLFCVNRVTSTDKQDWINGTKIQTLSGSQRGATTTGNINENITLSAINWQGARYYFSNRELAFSFISDGLSDSESSSLYNAVQAFQTTLGRQV